MNSMECHTALPTARLTSVCNTAAKCGRIAAHCGLDKLPSSYKRQQRLQHRPHPAFAPRPQIMAKNDDAVPITAVPVPQLAKIRERLAEDVETLAEQHAMLARVTSRCGTALRSVETLSESKTDQPLLLPLTSSLYVKAKVADTEMVLVNIGTDYYVEMSIDKATDYCRRRMLKIQQQQQGLQKLVQEKRNQLMQVTAVLQEKLQAGRQASSGAAS